MCIVSTISSRLRKSGARRQVLNSEKLKYNFLNVKFQNYITAIPKLIKLSRKLPTYIVGINNNNNVFISCNKTYIVFLFNSYIKVYF